MNWMWVLFLGVLCVAATNGEETSGRRQLKPITRLTYSRWINLLRYAYNALRRDPVRDHQVHFNRTEHVKLIANSMIKHFFNNHFNFRMTEEGGYVLDRIRIPVDFLIMLDSSASIGTDNFYKTLRMLTTLVSILDDADFTSGKLRVSMVSFSEPDKVIREFPFTSRHSKLQVLQKMNATEYHNGTSTSTVTALWMADTIFSRYSRSNATKVMLLATDGWSHNELQLPFGVLWPSARLRKLHDVNVYAIGIGDQINHNELKAIASRPTKNHLFEVEDYDMILEVLDKIKQHQSSSEEHS